MANEDIHIGKIIRDTLHEQGHSVTWFAQKLCCIRSNVYKIFKKHSLDASLILRISIILNKDLFSYYTDFFEKKHEHES